jgi:hypothetical protein
VQALHMTIQSFEETRMLEDDIIEAPNSQTGNHQAITCSEIEDMY